MPTMPSRILFLFLLMIFSLSARAQKDFYAGNKIQEIRISLTQSNWDTQLDSLKKNNPDQRLSGNATINGKTFRDVGIRYKGNSSYHRTRNETYKKLPFNVKLDLKNKSQLINNQWGTVKLSNAFLDPSFIRDPLAFTVMRKYMPASRCNFAKLYVNETFYGLYINTESVDSRFIKEHFGTDKGHLVKCDPDNWKRVRSQTGCPKGENASLMYLNDSPGCYDAFYEVDEVEAWEPLLNLIKILNRTPNEIESVLNVDQTLWMLALNNALVNLDSYNGSLSHNYYLWFDETGVAHPIIWDLNMAFGGWRRNFSFVEMKDEELVELQPLSEFNNPRRPLISQLLKQPLYRKIYLAHYKTIVKEVLESGELFENAQQMLTLIEPAVKEDKMKLYSDEDFKNSMDKTMPTGPDHVIGIRELMEARTKWLLEHPLLNKAQPSISSNNHQRSGANWVVTARLDNADDGYLCYRYDRAFKFERILMNDNGENGDAVANDGVFSAQVENKGDIQYYIAAENKSAAATLPERASFEYFKSN